MTIPFAREIKGRSMAAGLSVVLMAASGCYVEESVPTSAPNSPLPTADSSRPEQPEPPREDQGGETSRMGSVGRDLSRDLASPRVERGPTTYFAPAGTSQGVAYPDDATRAGQPPRSRGR